MAGENGFWSEGLGRLIKALDEQELEEVRALEDRLVSEPDADRRVALREELERVRAKFQRRRRGVDQSLFSRQ